MNKTIKYSFDIAFWTVMLIVYFIFFLGFGSGLQHYVAGFFIAAGMSFPVYIHDFLFEYFISRKSYMLYLLSSMFIALFFGSILNQLLETQEIRSLQEAYGSVLLFMMLYTGAKYIRNGAQYRIRVREEEQKRANTELELKEMAAKQAHAELDLLKSQVNPHFLFNALNSIYSLTLSNSEKAPDTVMKLSELMRYLLQSSGKRKVLVKHELEFLNNYIELERVRLNKKAQIHARFRGQAEGKIISPMLLIPFIENCFKHGIGLQYENNIIDISIDIEGNTIVLKTQNRIAPKRLNPDERKSGTGIVNAEKRLKLLYQGKHTLETKQEDNVYKIFLCIEI